MYSIIAIGWSWQTQLLTCYILGGSSGSVFFLYWKGGAEAGIPQTRWDVSAPSSFRSLCQRTWTMNSWAWTLSVLVWHRGKNSSLCVAQGLWLTATKLSCSSIAQNTVHSKLTSLNLCWKGGKQEGAALTAGVSWEAVSETFSSAVAGCILASDMGAWLEQRERILTAARSSSLRVNLVCSLVS